MSVPNVLTIRELKSGISGVVDQVQGGGVVFAGSHRKPEVVIMSVQQYEQITERQDAAIRDIVGTLDMEGMQMTATGQAALRELAAGLIDFEEYRRRILA